MNQTARIISIYAADTSGFCSALYEYGGMLVIHDASGCNSTYTTHDEPRWIRKNCMMYISGLTEKDAVMGNDDKLTGDLIEAANRLHPSFIALCASALPAMIGTDLESIAYEVENATGIPAFSVKTNAMLSYVSGADKALLMLGKRFLTKPDCKSAGKIFTDSGRTGQKPPVKVNVLGLTPLDFPSPNVKEKIENWLTDAGMIMNSSVSIDTDLADFKKLPEGDVTLLLSSTGESLAKFLWENYGIPCVTGVPYGEKLPSLLADALKTASSNRQNKNLLPETRSSVNGRLNGSDKRRVLICGESILSSSLALALALDKDIHADVAETVGEGVLSVLQPTDLRCEDEELLEQIIQIYDEVIADPLFRPICTGKEFHALPHEAFSGRCFTKTAPDILLNPLDELIP